MTDAAFATSLRTTLVLVLCAALLTAGCEGGTLTNYSQSCSSTSDLLSEETVTCSGEAETLSGSVGIEFGDRDEEEELLGTYRLTAEISVEEGEANVYSYDADGERFPLGRVSEGDPLRVEAVVEPSDGSTVFFVDAGEGKIGDLRYEGTIEPV